MNGYALIVRSAIDFKSQQEPGGGSVISISPVFPVASIPVETDGRDAGSRPVRTRPLPCNVIIKPGAGSREPGAGSREPGAGSREPGAGSREPGAGSREPGAGSREPGAGSREPGAGSREPGAGSREPGAGSREPGAGSREPGAGSREPGAGSRFPSPLRHRHGPDPAADPVGRACLARRERHSRLSFPGPRRPAEPSSSPSLPRFLSRLPRAAARLSLSALLLLAGLAAPAAADVLVSNTAETIAGNDNNAAEEAWSTKTLYQGFTTGSNSAGYTLETVSAIARASENSGTADLFMKLCPAGTGANSNRPDTSATCTDLGTVAYTDLNSAATGCGTVTVDPTDFDLAANTKYFVEFSAGFGGGPSICQTASNAQTGATGWTLENDSLELEDSSFDTIRTFLVQIDGTVKGASPNTAPTASDGTVETKEDVSYTFQASDFGFMDADSGDTELASVKIETLPASGKGTLELNGTAIGSGDLPQTVTKDDLDNDKLEYVPPDDANGDDYATFTFEVNDGEDDSASAYTMTIDVDSVPDVRTVSITSSPRSGTGAEKKYGEGETIRFTATFDEAVTVTGDPLFEFRIGPGTSQTTRNADYASGSETIALVFEYEVQSGDTDADGIRYSSNRIRLDTDTNAEDHIRGSDGDDADLSHTNLATQSGHKIDGSLTPPSDTTAPSATGAEVTAAKPKELVIDFDEALDTGSVPAAGAFTVKVGGSTAGAPSVSSVAIDGDKVKLALAVALDAGQTSVTVDYTKPGSDPLRDAAENGVATFTGRAVTNRAPACPASQPAAAFWTACLTAGEPTSFFATAGLGYVSGNYGALSDSSVSTGADTLTVDILALKTGTLQTTLDFQGHSEARKSVARNWALVVGGHTFRFADATYADNDSRWTWSNNRDWTGIAVGDKVSVSLRTGLTIAPTAVTVDEEGTETYTVKLAAQPSGSVTVDIASNDIGAATVSPAPLTFTTGNWGDAQTVTVTGLKDADENDESVTLTHSATGVTSREVAVTVRDNDGAPRVVSATVDGAELQITFNKDLLAHSLANGLFTVKVEPSGGSAAAVALSGSPSISGKTVTLTLAAAVRRSDTVTVSYAKPVSGNNNRLEDVNGTDVVNFDDRAVTNDTDPGLVFENDDGEEITGLEVYEEGVSYGVYLVRLDSEPPASVTVSVASGDTSAVAIVDHPFTLTFTAMNWDEGQWVRVAGADDPDKLSETVTITHSGTGVTTGTVTVKTLDNDADPPNAASNLRITAFNWDDGMTFEWDLPATQPVTVAKWILETRTGGPSGRWGIVAPLAERSAAFTSHTTNLLGSHSQVVRMVLESGEGGRAYSPELAVDAVQVPTNLAEAVAPWDEVTLSYEKPGTDNRNRLEDTGGREAASFTDFPVSNRTPVNIVSVVLSKSEVEVAEDGGTATYTVKLDRPPPAYARFANVRIDSLDPGAATVSPAAYSFNASNWDTPQTVTVTGVADPDVLDETVTVRNSIDYTDSLTLVDFLVSAGEAVTVTVTDDDVPAILVSKASVDLIEGGTATWTVQLDTEPLATVTVDLVSGDTNAATVRPSSLEFAASNWNTPREVTVTGVGDADSDGEDTMVTHRATGLVDVQVAVTVNDDDAGACPSGQPASAIWQACLTIGKEPGGLGLYGLDTDYGALSDDLFTFRGAEMRITALAYQAAPKLTLSSGEVYGHTDLVLQVGSTLLNLPAEGGGTYEWANPGFSWGDADVGNKVSVSLWPKADADLAAPRLHSARIRGAELTLTFDERLHGDLAARTVARAFSVKADGTAMPLSAADPATYDGHATLTLRLAEAVDRSDTVTVTYSRPGDPSNFIRDRRGNPLLSFTDRAVVNTTTACRDHPEDAFWTACLTIGQNGPGTSFGFGGTGAGFGALSAESFTLDGSTHEIDGLRKVSGGGLALTFADDPGSAADAWVLEVGGRNYALGGSNVFFERTGSVGFGVSAHTWSWAGGPGWASGDVGGKVSVSLRERRRHDKPNWFVIRRASGAATDQLHWCSEYKDGKCIGNKTRQLRLSEGQTGSYKLGLGVKPDREVTVRLRPRDPGATRVSPRLLTFTPSNYRVGQVVTVEALQDSDGLDEYTDVIQEGGGAPPFWFDVRIADDDEHFQAGHSLVYNDSCHCLKVAPDDTKSWTFPVRPRFRPEESVTVSWNVYDYPNPGESISGSTKTWEVTAPEDGNGLKYRGIKVSPMSLTFTRDNWQTAQNFTVTTDNIAADTDIEIGAVMGLRPWWPKEDRYPYTKSPEFRIEVVDPASLSTSVPGAPTVEVYSGDGEVRLDWTPAEDDDAVTNWQFRHGEMNLNDRTFGWGRWTAVPGGEADARAHTVTGLANGTLYGFQVRGMAGHRAGRASDTSITAPLAGAESHGHALKRPELDVRSGNAQAELSWDDIAYGGTITGWNYRYGVLDSADNTVDWNDWTAVPGADADTREHTVTGLTNDVEYGVQLRAVAGEVLGEMSERETAWPYHPWIEDAAVTAVTATTVSLGWTLPHGVTPTGLRVQQRSGPPKLDWGEWRDAAELALDAAAHTVTGLAPATQYQFRIVLDSATGGTRTGLIEQETAAAVLDTKMSGSESENRGNVRRDSGNPFPLGRPVDSADPGNPFSLGRSVDSADSADSAERNAGQGCAVEVTVEFLDDDGNAVAVTGLAATDFTAQNGRVGTPVAAADGLSWTVPVRAATDRRGFLRVRLPATERWEADEQVFHNRGAGVCVPAARRELAYLRLYDQINLSPPFHGTRTDYTSETMDAEAEVVAEAVYGDATVTIAPADADGEAEGHQVALAGGETEITVTVTPGDGSAARTYTVTVTREAEVSDAGVLTGFVLVDALTDADLGPIADGDTVSVSAGGSYGIRAEVDGSEEVSSVALRLKGPGPGDAHERTEGIAPYSLYGDTNGGADGSAEHGRALAAGSYTLTATAHALPNGGGRKLGTLTVSFTAAVEAAAPAAPSTGALTGFTLVDVSDQSTVAALADGMDVDLGAGFAGRFGIRAEVDPNAGVASVALRLEGPGANDAHERTEGIAPYSLWGDGNSGPGSALHGEALPAGPYTLTATAWSEKKARGGMLGTRTASFRVLAPPALSAGDAEAEEGTDAALGFAVTLDREAAHTVTVAYATSDGTATAGDDYTATSGTLTFAAGDREKTVSVPVLVDNHDEGSETMTLTLSGPSGAAIADGEATGTITNDGPVPEAWLARFGRTVTGQVLEAVEERLAAPRQAGGRMSLAGQALPSWGGGSSSADGGSAGADDKWSTADKELSTADGGAADGPGTAGDAPGIRTAFDADGELSNADGELSTADGELSTADGGEAMEAIRDWMVLAADDGSSSADGMVRFETRGLTSRDFRTGTSFDLTVRTGEGPGGGHASLWGRGSIASFDGRDGSLAVDGEVTTALVGADRATDRRVAGLALGHSTGTGGWRRGGECDNGKEINCGGDIDATLTGLYPYAGIHLTDRLSLWAAAGYGAGEVTVTPEGQAGLSADLALWMGAAGVRSEVLRPEGGQGLALAVKGDLRFTRTSSGAVTTASGNLAAADADTWLLRTGIEGSRRFPLGTEEDGASLTPSFEVALRLDGGDAETGFGADLGGGIAFADPGNGLALGLRARGLAAHEASGFREWGASLSAAWDPRPGSDRGLSLTLTQNWGASPTGGMDALLSRETLAGLAPDDGDGGGGFEASRRLEGTLGYGLPAFGGRFTGTPNLGFGLSGGGARDWRIGWRLTRAGGGSAFELNLDATRREPVDDEPEHGAMLRAAIRW